MFDDDAGQPSVAQHGVARRLKLGLRSVSGSSFVATLGHCPSNCALASLPRSFVGSRVARACGESGNTPSRSHEKSSICCGQIMDLSISLHSRRLASCGRAQSFLQLPALKLGQGTLLHPPQFHHCQEVLALQHFHELSIQSARTRNKAIDEGKEDGKVRLAAVQVQALMRVVQFMQNRVVGCIAPLTSNTVGPQTLHKNSSKVLRIDALKGWICVAHEVELFRGMGINATCGSDAVYFCFRSS